MTGITHRPTRLSGLIGLLFALGTVGVGARTNEVTLAVGTVAILLFVAGLIRMSRDMLGWGAIGLLIVTLFSTISEPRAILGVGSAFGSLLAWDAAEHAIGLGEQMGWEAPTGRQELIHTGASLSVALVGFLAWFVTVRFTPTGLTFPVLVAVLVGVFVIVVALR